MYANVQVWVVLVCIDILAWGVYVEDADAIVNERKEIYGEKAEEGGSWFVVKDVLMRKKKEVNMDTKMSEAERGRDMPGEGEKKEGWRKTSEDG